MSGIVGILSDAARVDRALVERLTDFLSFRGPDGRGMWCSDTAGLGYSWLDTAREAAGREPPLTLDGRTFVVADARLDGRPELLQKLRDQGVVAAVQATDAELLLHAFRVWGEDCVLHLLGDFAFAVWDEPLQWLFAARDHFGVKPFCYVETADGLLFGNTLDCLRRHPEVSPRLNERAVADHLLFGFNQDPRATTLADVQRLPPAHTLSWSRGQLRTRRYWTLPTDGSIRCSDPQEVIDRFRDLLRTAVADRMPAGNVAVLMSGGLDSTSVAALAKDVCNERSHAEALHAFTVVFDRLIADPERHYSGLAAQALGLPIHYLAVDDYLPFQEMTAGEWRFSELFDDSGAAAVFADNCSRTADHARVCLSGHGGDAVLYGSQTYMMNLLRRGSWLRWFREVTRYYRAHRRLPPLGLRSWLKRVVGLGPAREPFPAWLNSDFVQRLGLRERWREINGTALASGVTVHPTHAEAHRILSRPFWPWLFEAENPARASFSLEFRYPFFDVRLVNFVLAISPLPWCADKWLLRAAMRERLPDSIRLRPKQPLNGDPLSSLFRLNSLKWLDYLDDMRPLAPYVDCGRIRQSADSHVLDSSLTRPISLLNWLRRLSLPTTVLEREMHHHERAKSDSKASVSGPAALGLRHRP